MNEQELWLKQAWNFWAKEENDTVVNHWMRGMDIFQVVSRTLGDTLTSQTSLLFTIRYPEGCVPTTYYSLTGAVSFPGISAACRHARSRLTWLAYRYQERADYLSGQPLVPVREFDAVVASGVDRLDKILHALDSFWVLPDQDPCILGGHRTAIGRSTVTMKRITVVTSDSDRKSRSFSGFLAAYITSNGLWPGGSVGQDVLRPTWAVILATEGQSRALVTNLVLGKKAEVGDRPTYSRRAADKLEFLKSSGFVALTQREPGCGVCTTLVHPDLFSEDPGMVDPTGIRFVLAIPASEAKAQVWDRDRVREDLIRINSDLSRVGDQLPTLLDLIPYLAVYLDRRIRVPMLHRPSFYGQLLLACLDKGLASLPCEEGYYYRDRPWGQHPSLGIYEEGTQEFGLCTPLAFCASHEDFQALLVETMTRFVSSGR